MAPLTSPGQERDAAELAAPLVAPEGLTPWMGWRLRVLMGLALAACVAVFGLMRWLAESPQLPLAFADGPGTGAPRLVLKQPSGLTPVATLAAPDGTSLLPPPGAQLLPRWQVHDDARSAQLAWQRTIHAAAAAAPLVVSSPDGKVMPLSAQAQGYGGLGGWFWPLVALALLLVLLGAVVVLAQPHPGNALFAVVAWTQAAGLMLQASLSLPGLLVPPTLLALDLPLRGALDLVACAAVVHALSTHPRRVPAWRAYTTLAWGVAVAAALVAPWLPAAWWWLQGSVLALSVLAAWVLFRARARGFGAVQRLTQGLVTAACSGLALITTLAVMAGAGRGAGPAPAWLATAVPLWQVFVAALLLTPLLMRSRQVMREFALLASISVLAASLDLLFVAVFSLSAFSSLAIVVFVSLGVYAGLRQWLFDRLSGTAMLTTERAFGQLYRAARIVQGEPDRLVEQLAQVLRDLFEPLELLQSTRPIAFSRVAGGGGSLLVPVPSLVEAIAAAQALGNVPHTTPGPKRAVATLVLRHARRGQRIFRVEDARLADRVVEQLQRAVAYDLAVERGRGEERSRIAQDLHDDIGARLLTLMYRATDRATEDYVRDTLKDLKTLTRGLAAGEQPLSLALAEWRSDVEQRCTAARVSLDWQSSVDHDLRLSIVAWSGLTRVLREVVSNTLQHGHARHVHIHLRLTGGAFTLRVSDDGDGRKPEAWSQGLGLGGVRKRVKLLGGTVTWRELAPRGIECEVQLPNLPGSAA